MPQFEAQMQLQLLNCANQTSKSMKSGDTDDALESSHTSASVKELKRVKREELEELPWDVLDVICDKLDFDDLFQFSGVCKSWNTFHKSNFLSSQEPLLVRNFVRNGTTHVYSFITIPNQKTYDLNIMSCFPPPNFTYIRASSQYFIMARYDNSFLLFNPFTRVKKVINANFKVHARVYGQHRYHALLAFEKLSDEKEFVLLILCIESRTLYVYQSRRDSWVTYSTMEQEYIVDFVVFNNIIYVVTNKPNIGVLNLNYGNIQFLNLNNAPNTFPSESFRLLNCDEQLLMCDVVLRKNVYKVDLSTMNYVKMESLGDIALFYVSHRNCQALSNPRRFGYQSNCVYEANAFNRCDINHWNYGSRIKTYETPGSYIDRNLFDWCFRHLKFEVDYSLVE